MKTIEAHNLPEGEEVYLKKDWTGWRVVEPIVHPTTKKFIWKNLFSKKGFLFLIVFIIIGLSFYSDVQRFMKQYNEVLENPCPYCSDCHAYATQMCGLIKIEPTSRLNVSILNLTT